VISIKKYLDLDQDELSKYRPPTADELLSGMLEAYRAALGGMGNSAFQACPAVGADLQRRLMPLAEDFTKALTLALIRNTEGEVEQHLRAWGEQTAGYLQQRAADVKEIVLVLACAAESVAERDQRYAAHFNEFTKRLQALAKLEDLPELRAAVVSRAKELKSCVDKMQQESRESVAALQTKVTTYEAKLEEAEQRASRDALTGLENRQGVESKVQRWTATQQRFCVAMLDLNGFKQVNDLYGHEAGDELLRQFSAELRSTSRVLDVVGRWGGDEFIVVLDGTLADARARVQRIQEWVLGSYTVQNLPEESKIDMSAAVGLAEWQPGETFKEVVARADALMYQEKKRPAQERKNPETRAA
jgi:diguanylate cyclase (GGDEF)-like protein